MPILDNSLIRSLGDRHIKNTCVTHPRIHWHIPGKWHLGLTSDIFSSLRYITIVHPQHWLSCTLHPFLPPGCEGPNLRSATQDGMGTFNIHIFSQLQYAKNLQKCAKKRAKPKTRAKPKSITQLELITIDGAGSIQDFVYVCSFPNWVLCFSY